MQHGKTNLTISVDQAALKKARIRAINEGTSVNDVLRKFLKSYAGVTAAQSAAVKDILRLSRKSKARSDGRRWTRDELHGRR